MSYQLKFVNLQVHKCQNCGISARRHDSEDLSIYKYIDLKPYLWNFSISFRSLKMSHQIKSVNFKVLKCHKCETPSMLHKLESLETTYLPQSVNLKIQKCHDVGIPSTHHDLVDTICIFRKYWEIPDTRHNQEDLEDTYQNLSQNVILTKPKLKFLWDLTFMGKLFVFRLTF